MIGPNKLTNYRLDLDAWINEPIEDDSSSDSEPQDTDNLFVKSEKLDYGKPDKYRLEPTEEDIEKVRYQPNNCSNFNNFFLES